MPKKNQNEEKKEKPKREKNGSLVWSIIFLMFSLAEFSTNGWLAGLLFLAVSAAFSPIVVKKMKATGSYPEKKYRVAALAVMIIAAFMAVPRSQSDTSSPEQQASVATMDQTISSPADQNESEDTQTEEEKSLENETDAEDETEKQADITDNLTAEAEATKADQEKTTTANSTADSKETVKDQETEKETTTQSATEAVIPETTSAEITTAASEPTTPTTSGEMQVYYLDCGQSDCTVIISDDGSCLVFDAGDNSCGTKIQSFLINHGVTKIDTLIVSHFDADHCGGADVLITKYDIGRVIYPSQTKDTATCRDVLDAMSYKGYKVTPPVVGETYALGGASYTIIAPGRSDYSDVNDSSVGMILTYGTTRFLFTGDAEAEGEADILSSGIDISCDVYQAGHHGSRTSSSSALLDAASPAYVVISCGEGNSYGHPHAETLNALRQRGISVYRTDEQGTIVCVSDGTTIKFDGSPSTSWQAGEPTENSQTQATTAAPTTAAPTTAAPTTEAPTTVAQTEAQTEIQTQPQASGTDYICNVNTMKFHYPGCASVKRMSEKNKLYYNGTRDELIQQGYSPCGNCNP